MATTEQLLVQIEPASRRSPSSRTGSKDAVIFSQLRKRVSSNEKRSPTLLATRYRARNEPEPGQLVSSNAWESKLSMMDKTGIPLSESRAGVNVALTGSAERESSQARSRATGSLISEFGNHYPLPSPSSSAIDSASSLSGVASVRTVIRPTNRRYSADSVATVISPNGLSGGGNEADDMYEDAPTRLFVNSEKDGNIFSSEATDGNSAAECETGDNSCKSSAVGLELIAVGYRTAASSRGTAEEGGGAILDDQQLPSPSMNSSTVATASSSTFREKPTPKIGLSSPGVVAASAAGRLPPNGAINGEGRESAGSRIPRSRRGDGDGAAGRTPPSGRMARGRKIFGAGPGRGSGGARGQHNKPRDSTGANDHPGGGGPCSSSLSSCPVCVVAAASTHSATSALPAPASTPGPDGAPTIAAASSSFITQTSRVGRIAERSPPARPCLTAAESEPLHTSTSSNRHCSSRSSAAHSHSHSHSNSHFQAQSPGHVQSLHCRVSNNGPMTQDTWTRLSSKTAGCSRVSISTLGPCTSGGGADGWLTPTASTCLSPFIPHRLRGVKTMPCQIPKSIGVVTCSGCATKSFFQADGPQMHTCVKCRSVYYCSLACAEVDAESHRAVCISITKGRWQAIRPSETSWVVSRAMAKGRRMLHKVVVKKKEKDLEEKEKSGEKGDAHGEDGLLHGDMDGRSSGDKREEGEDGDLRREQMLLLSIDEGKEREAHTAETIVYAMRLEKVAEREQAARQKWEEEMRAQGLDIRKN